MKNPTTRLILGLVFILFSVGGVFWSITQISEAKPSSEDADVIKILIEHEGMYRIPVAELQQFGWENVDPASLGLTNGGEPYPFVVTGEGADLQIIFYGRAPDATLLRYTPYNAFFLSLGSGETNLASIEEIGGAGVEPSLLTVTTIFEENSIYSPRLEEGRPWFWLQLPAPGSRTIDFSLEAAGSGRATIRMEWFGSTGSVDVDPDHHLIIHLNGTQIADEAWDGIGAHSIAIELDTEIFEPGQNSLVFEAPGDTGVPADIILLDSFSITYPQLAGPKPGGVAFIAAERSYFFPVGTVLFDVSKPQRQLTAERGAGEFQTTPGGRYLAVLEGKYRDPVSLLPAKMGSDLRANSGGSFLVLASEDLLDAVRPLLEHRSSQGLSTLAVTLEDVYDQFGHGMSAPQGIRAFLQYAKANWAEPPVYVLLLGDWSYDPHGFTTPVIENGLPSFFTFTEFGGETVSDVAFAKLDDDELPDLAVGRIPARTVEQVRLVVDKIIAFETRPPEGAWDRRVLAIADPTEPTFKRDAEEYLALFSDAYDPVLISADAMGGEASGVAAEVASVKIDEEIRAGVLLMSYFGHGSLTQLGKDALFTADQAAQLENGRFTPIMVNITCLAGLFTHPSVESLSEAMLWNDKGGAIASLGATSLTLPFYQAFLSGGFVEALLQLPGGRLGDVLLHAQRQMPVDNGPGSLEVLDTFLLFGDPALLVP